MICSYCGTDLPEGAMFCGECGRPVPARAEAKSRSKASASSVATSTRWPSSVAEHQPGSRPKSEDAVDAPPPRRPAANTDAAPRPDLVEPPRAADAVFAEPPASARHVTPAATEQLATEPPAADPPVADPQVTDPLLAHPIVIDLLAPRPLVIDIPVLEPEPVPVVEPERVATVEPEPEPVTAAQPEPVAVVPVAAQEPESHERAVEERTVEPPEPTLEPAVAQEPEIAARPAPDASLYLPPVEFFEPSVVWDLTEVGAPAETCAQCGAPVAASDIFCGECGFVRKSVTTPAARPNDTVAYDPFPWGLPRATDAVPPALAPEAPPAPTYDDDSDIEATRLVERSGRGDRFVLQFSTGESVSVSGTGLIGRNPVAEPGEYFDSLVTIVDPGKSVSKTHLEFGQDTGVFWVSDRYSANGTVLREPDRPARRGDAGKRYRLVRGTRVDIGEQFFIVS